MKRQKVSVVYLVLAIVFCICLVTSNILVAKRTTLGFTGGLLVFPISYIIGDVTTEVYGYKAARRIIWLGFAMNFFVVAVGALAALLPGVEGDAASAAVDTIFSINGGMALIVACASMVSFVLGSIANAWIMHKMREHDGDKLFSLRAIVSTIVGEGIDSLIFFPIAFSMALISGDMTVSALLWMMFMQVSLKTVYEIIVLPITMQVVKKVKKIEEEA